jgi:carnitine-CoA ligase
MAMIDPMMMTAIQERTVVAVLEKQVGLRPDKVAVIDDNQSMTYGTLLTVARRVNNALQAIGVGRQEFVLVMLDNHVDNVVAWLGLSVGAMAIVPVNSAYKGEMLRYVAANCGARVAIIEGEYCARFAELLADLPNLEILIVRGEPNAEFPSECRVVAFDSLMDAPASRPNAPEVFDVAALLYTSGTEGASKGVLSPHGHAFQISASYTYETVPSDVVLVTLPMFHASGLFAGVFNALRGGATAVIRHRFSASGFWDDVRAHGCTQTLLMGAMADFLWRQPASEADADHPLRNLTVVPAMAYIQDFADRFGVNVTSSYGGAETGSPLLTDPGEAEPSLCGRPRSFIQMRLVDDNDIEVPPGETGEIVVRSTEPWSLMAGYHGMPDVTSRAWRNLWLHTGDSAFQDQRGRYFFVDRKKDALRRRGENVSSLEVEGYLLARSDIQAAAIVAVPSEFTEDEIKAVVVLAPGADFNPEAILRDLQNRLPYFMVPRFYEAVAELPMTPTLKVKKHELRASGINPNTWDCGEHGLTVTRDGIREVPPRQ